MVTNTTTQSFFHWFFIHGIKTLMILVVAWILVRIGDVFTKKVVKAFIERGYGARKDYSKELQDKRIETLSRVSSSFLKILVWTFAVLTILPEFGINIGPLLAGVGIIGLALGMGARNLIQDYLAGIFIIFEDQYRIGEEIEILGKRGKVLDINLRRTVLKGEKEVYYIPNGQVKVVSNLSRNLS